MGVPTQWERAPAFWSSAFGLPCREETRLAVQAQTSSGFQGESSSHALCMCKLQRRLRHWLHLEGKVTDAPATGVP